VCAALRTQRMDVDTSSPNGELQGYLGAVLLTCLFSLAWSFASPCVNTEYGVCRLCSAATPYSCCDLQCNYWRERPISRASGAQSLSIAAVCHQRLSIRTGAASAKARIRDRSRQTRTTRDQGIHAGVSGCVEPTAGADQGTLAGDWPRRGRRCTGCSASHTRQEGDSIAGSCPATSPRAGRALAIRLTRLLHWRERTRSSINNSLKRRHSNRPHMRAIMFLSVRRFRTNGRFCNRCSTVAWGSSAVASLDQQGRVHEYTGREERLSAIAKEYALSPEKTLVVSPDNRSRAEINQRIHGELQSLGIVSREEHAVRTLVPRQELTGANRTWAQ